jgi:micrococcal nuclease
MRAAVAVVALLLVTAGCLGGTPDVGTSPTETPAEPTATPVPAPADSTATPHPDTAPQVTAEVVDVVDGDTVKVRYANGSRDTVRLLGVDTPEVHSPVSPDEFPGVPDTAAGRTCLREWGERASAFAVERLDGRQVELGFDPNEGRRGYYGRLLAYVYVDGTQFNHDLVERGYARVYESRFVDRPRFEATAERARSEGRGLWGACATDGGTAGGATATDGGSGTEGGTDPAASTTADGLTVAVVADAPGNDNENLNGEYVTVTNRGDDGRDLSGWQVSDATGKTYTFPEGTTLDPGASLRLYTGSGTDGEGAYYWGRSGAVWNNDGDTLVLVTADGTVVVELSY